MADLKGNNTSVHEDQQAVLTTGNSPTMAAVADFAMPESDNNSEGFTQMNSTTLQGTQSAVPERDVHSSNPYAPTDGTYFVVGMHRVVPTLGADIVGTGHYDGNFDEDSVVPSGDSHRNIGRSVETERTLDHQFFFWENEGNFYGADDVPTCTSFYDD